MLFPCLRATADLLMMPKEVLTDRAIRAEVVPGLSLRRICQLLNRFLPDDFAPDPLPPGQGPARTCVPVMILTLSCSWILVLVPTWLRIWGHCCCVMAL